MSNQPREAARSSSGSEFVQSQILKAPKGASSGNFVIIDYETLAKATHSARLHNFINVGKLQQELPINKSKRGSNNSCDSTHSSSATIPQYVPRKSQNDLKTLASVDPSLRGKLTDFSSILESAHLCVAKITKRQKKSKIHVPKASRPRTVSTVPRAPGSKESPMSPSSESESSDYDSDSSYDSEDEAEPSPLPASRPPDPVQAVRYDTIKAVWLPRNVFAQDESIRKGLKEFWEIIKTIRDRWKTDSDAVKKAAEAKKDSELPMLKDRVNNQRDMMEVAVKASIEHGYPDLMRAYVHPRIPSLLFVCMPVYVIGMYFDRDMNRWSLPDGDFICLASNHQNSTGVNMVFLLKPLAGCEPSPACLTKCSKDGVSSSKEAHSILMKTMLNKTIPCLYMWHTGVYHATLKLQVFLQMFKADYE
jgi:hypothetical protein